MRKEKPAGITLCKSRALVPSHSEGRRAIQQGCGISIDGEKITDIYHTVEKDAFAGRIILKRGKKIQKICVK